MPNEKSLENLKKHQFTSNQSRDKAAINGKKGGIKSGRAKTLRALGKLMLSTPMQLDEKNLKTIQKSGFDTDAPELQMVILARLGALATSKDANIAMKAINMLMEITGNDVRSINAEEQRKIERERLALEREKMEQEARSKSPEEANRRFESIIEAVKRIE